MHTQQILIFGLLGVIFFLLLWGKFRYDLIAFGALVVAVIIGVVPEELAFNGFAHPATMIIAFVLVVSKGLSNSGAIELIAKYTLDKGRSLAQHISIMSAVAAGLSALMNNVAALALLMPVDIEAATKAKRSASLSLMPLSFASILGGLITLIGTPPNIIIASFRGEALGQPFGMFDFSPVGLAVAFSGVLFISLIGWRLIPGVDETHDITDANLSINDYVAELRVAENSPLIGKSVSQINTELGDDDIVMLGLIHDSIYATGSTRRIIQKDDYLIFEASAKDIDSFIGEYKLEYVREEEKSNFTGEDLTLLEMVVPAGARIEGRSAISLNLLHRFGISLVGVSRKGHVFRKRVRQIRIEAGDMLLLLGPTDSIKEVGNWIGALPLQNDDHLQVIQRKKAGIAVTGFIGAISLATLGVISLTIALAVLCLFFIVFRIVPLRELYTSIEWPVIVLLGSMIPIGQALEASGGTALIAQEILNLAADYGPVVVLTLLMIVTMTLSDVMNNTATAVIAAPIALDLATRLEVNPDSFLMAVAVAASCAFLTPIGHKNNTLIMGPGGYRFGDYWRMGLPLEIIVIAVSIPMILLVWPL